MDEQEVTLKDLSRRKVVYLSCKGPWRQLPDMLTRLSEYASRSGIDTLGPPSGFYYNTPKEVAIEELIWEICSPVGPNTPEYADDELKAGVREMPATRVAAIVHKGSYRKATQSYDRLQAWIETQGLGTCGPAEEVYITALTGPHEGHRIEIRLPVC